MENGEWRKRITDIGRGRAVSFCFLDALLKYVVYLPVGKLGLR